MHLPTHPNKTEESRNSAICQQCPIKIAQTLAFFFLTILHDRKETLRHILLLPNLHNQITKHDKIQFIYTHFPFDIPMGTKINQKTNSDRIEDDNGLQHRQTVLPIESTTQTKPETNSHSLHARSLPKSATGYNQHTHSTQRSGIQSYKTK